MVLEGLLYCEMELSESSQLNITNLKNLPYAF